MYEEQKWEMIINLLTGIHSEIQLLNASLRSKEVVTPPKELIHVSFKGSELYLLHKAFIDAGGAPNETYTTLTEKTVPFIANKTQRGFSPQSFCKYSDKVDPEAKETVKRFLQKMIRNIESYD